MLLLFNLNRFDYNRRYSFCRAQSFCILMPNIMEITETVQVARRLIGFVPMTSFPFYTRLIELTRPLIFCRVRSHLRRKNIIQKSINIVRQRLTVKMSFNRSAPLGRECVCLYSIIIYAVIVIVLLFNGRIVAHVHRPVTGTVDREEGSLKL